MRKLLLLDNKLEYLAQCLPLTELFLCSEQIGNVENELDKQNATMRQAEASMTEMEKFCGYVKCHG
jgi:hypothetical protein